MPIVIAQPLLPLPGLAPGIHVFLLDGRQQRRSTPVSEPYTVFEGVNVSRVAIVARRSECPSTATPYDRRGDNPAEAANFLRDLLRWSSEFRRDP
jgi:hypothetical protein